MYGLVLADLFLRRDLASFRAISRLSHWRLLVVGHLSLKPLICLCEGPVDPFKAVRL